MALTQDQASRLETAIDNLNKSVQINQEVLEVVKSVGNTGAVDIATHNNDADAHKEFNSVYSKNVVQISGDVSDPYNTQSALIRLEKTETGISIDAYRNIDHLDTALLIRSICFKDGFVDNDLTTKTGISLQSRERNSDGYLTLSRLDFSESTDRDQYIRVAVYNKETTKNLYYYFYNTAFVVGTPVDIGESAFQFKDAYLQNSPIVSSDERLKQDIEEIPESVFKAWARVNFKQYRFKESVASKSDEARKHVGLIAQHILAAFEAEGLDATDYGIVCHDSWDDQYVDEQVIDAEAVYDKDGKVVTPEKSHTEKRFVKAAGDVWTVRYEEALALETAYHRWRLSKIEAALAAKGITL